MSLLNNMTSKNFRPTAASPGAQGREKLLCGWLLPNGMDYELKHRKPITFFKELHQLERDRAAQNEEAFGPLAFYRWESAFF